MLLPGAARAVELEGENRLRGDPERNEIDRPTGQFRLRSGRKPVWGREGATPLGPHLRRVCGDDALASCAKDRHPKGRDAAMRLGEWPRARVEPGPEGARPHCQFCRIADLLHCQQILHSGSKIDFSRPMAYIIAQHGRLLCMQVYGSAFFIL